MSLVICSNPQCQTTAGCICQRTPSPTGTELALAEAKRHIAILIRFWMDNPAWTKAAEDARAFIAGVPANEAVVAGMERGHTEPPHSLPHPSGREG